MTFLSDSWRSTVLRGPQGGTPSDGDDSLGMLMPVIVDRALLDMRLARRDSKDVVLLLAKVQYRAFASTGHILSYADEYVWRKIKRSIEIGRIPTIYVRCMRCGCLAHFAHWAIAVDYLDAPLLPGRRLTSSAPEPTNPIYRDRCKGDIEAAGLLSLLE
jgi:hypothetical protein